MGKGKGDGMGKGKGKGKGKDKDKGKGKGTPFLAMGVTRLTKDYRPGHHRWTVWTCDGKHCLHALTPAELRILHATTVKALEADATVADPQVFVIKSLEHRLADQPLWHLLDYQGGQRIPNLETPELRELGALMGDALARDETVHPYGAPRTAGSWYTED